MFKSLRAKLISSYFLIVFLSLLLAGSAALFLFDRYQERVAYREMRLLVTVMAVRALALLNQQPPLEVVRRLSLEMEAAGGRLLLLDAEGRVIADSADGPGLDGQRLELPPAGDMVKNPRRSTILRHDAPGAGEFLYVVVPLSSGERAGLTRAGPRYIALARPVPEVRGAWRELAQPLAGAAALALIAAVLVGMLLSRSITGPIARMTQASEAMARGDYAQTIPGGGQDEVGRLAQAFNAMAREVKRAHQMERDLVANVSHDLKTPLTAIQGFAQALVDGTAQDRQAQARAAQIILEEAQRMRRLIQDLLDLARLESGQMPIAHEPVDLVALLADVGRTFGPRAEQSGITLSLRLPPTLPPIPGDAVRLEQVFSNLLDNALRYTPAGGQIEVAASPTSEGTVEIIVSDTGCGIPPEELPRIFERFYRLDKARAGSGGTGLGLAIVREIVSAHEGSIRAASQVGQGSRFTVTLPSGAR